jgi:hypothetical protein
MLEKHTQELAQLSAEAAVIDAKIKAVKLKLIDEFKAQNIKSYQTDYGNFTLTQKKSYTYTDEVKKLEEACKLRKVEEEERGLAEVKVSEFITVRSKVE